MGSSDFWRGVTGEIGNFETKARIEGVLTRTLSLSSDLCGIRHDCEGEKSEEGRTKRFLGRLRLR